MILNMSGVKNSGRVFEYTFDTDDPAGTNLVLTNVDVPGGVVNGFLFVLDNHNNYTPTDFQIIYIYADAENAKQNKAVMETITANGTMNTYNSAGFAYDKSSHNFTLINSTNFAYLRAGDYRLCIW